MSRINKQVIIDYFKSFFEQYSLTKEQINKVRSLVDEAECGCCQVVTVYWPETETSAPSPENQQIIFRDANDNILSQTSVEGVSPQRLCVPREAVQVCISVLEVTNVDGTVTVTGSSGFSASVADEVDETCSDVVFPLDDIYIIATVAPEIVP